MFTSPGPLGQQIRMPQDLVKLRHCAGLKPIEFEDGEKPSPEFWKADNQCDGRLVNALNQYRDQVQAVAQVEVGLDLSPGPDHTENISEDGISLLILVLTSGLVDPTTLTVLRLPFCRIHVGSQVFSSISIWLTTTSTLTLLE